MSLRESIIAYLKLSAAELDFILTPIERVTIPDHTHFKNIDVALHVIHEAMANHEKIVIYGDYDCDGVMATSILVKCFKLLNYEVGYFLPSRYLDGYGLSVKRVEQMAAKGYKLIITVDNGISQVEAVARAYSLGMKVIITDHHEPQAIIPECEVILHPILSDYGEISCCGAYVAFMLSSALLKRVDPYFLSLAAVATISDMMYLRGYNRNIVRLGLKYINDFKYDTLTLLADEDDIDENTLGIKIAPKVNALGRILRDSKNNILIKYFISDDIQEIKNILHFIETINETRKELCRSSYQQLPEIDSSESAIVTLSDAEEGILGLLANRLMDLYQVPVIVLTHDHLHPDFLKGSARSLVGFKMNQALESLRDILTSFGGHEQACGLSLKKDDFPVFKKRFLEYIASHPPVKVIADHIEIEFHDINYKTYMAIREFAPFGSGFRMPPLLIRHFSRDDIKYSNNKNHIMMSPANNVKIIGFNYGPDKFVGVKTVDFMGFFEKSRFRGLVSYDFKISQIVDNNGKEILPNNQISYVL